jgi:hypothetical protein
MNVLAVSLLGTWLSAVPTWVESCGIAVSTAAVIEAA